MPSLVRKASAFAFEEFATIRRGTNQMNDLSRQGGVPAPALPDTTAFRRHGFRLNNGEPMMQNIFSMLLTAAAVVVGSFVIVFDPIFQGLALAMMFGEIASTTLSRVTIPILYYLVQSWKERHHIGETKEVV